VFIAMDGNKKVQTVTFVPTLPNDPVIAVI